MEGIHLLKDFATILIVAAVTGWIFRKLGLSAVVGYLVAGIAIGPYTPPFTFVSDIERIRALSELGLVFLMFFVGMGLSLKRIKTLGATVVIATALTATMVFNLSQLFSWAMGWDATMGLIFAAMLMTSSSAIIVKLLAELGLTHERFAQNSQGITVLEDVVAVVMLTIIGSRLHLAGEAGGRDVGQTLFLLLGFTVVTVVLGLIFVPRLLRKVGQASDADLKSILVSGLVFGAGVASISAGFSVALGAFLFGVVIAETAFKSRIEKRLSGAQDMFSAIFFVSIGMLIDVRAFWENAGLIAAISAFAIVARIFASNIGLLATGTPVRLAASSAVILTPIGEFAYIIAQLGVGAKAVPESFYAVAVGTSIVTAALLPLFAKNAESAGLLAERLVPARWIGLHERYRDWLDDVAERFAKNAVWQLTKRRVFMTLLELLLLAGLFGFATPIRDGIGGFLQEAGYEIAGWRMIFWGVVCVIAVTLVIAIWRGLHALSMIYAEALTMKAEQVAALRPLVQLALQALSAVGLALLVFFTFPIQTSVPWLALVLILAPVLFAMLTWRQLIRLHGRFENSLASAVEEGAGSSRLTRAATDRRNLHWGLEIADCELPDHAACAGKSIKDLAIRSKFGCSILEIDRQGFVIANPKPSMGLFPGDRVLLVGAEAQIEKAREFLSTEREFQSAESDFDETVLETIVMPSDSPAAGKSLASLGIFSRTGVQIVGIQKGDRRILNPAGSETLDPGNLLLVIATAAEIRTLERWLENPW